MKNRLLSVTALGFLLAALFVAALPAWAADVDQRIRTLEEELTRLKSEQTQVKAEQIELKKNALAAEGALPTFSYRPGNGLLIEAADKSWSFRASMETHFRMLFESGKDEAGRINGEIMGRRFRPFFYYGVNNGLYEIEYGLDNDGFGTGNAKNSTATGGSSILQRGIFWVHLEKISPWLPTFYFGMDGPSSISSYRQGSSSTGTQREYDLLSRNNGFNTGRFGNGFGFNWDDKPLDAIGIPGRLVRFNTVVASIGEGDDGLSSFKDSRNFNTYMNIEPFSQVKNKWIQGLGFEVGAFFCNNNARAEVTSGTGSTVVGTVFVTGSNTRQPGADNACDRLRIQDHGDAGRQTLFDTGSGSLGRGLATLIMPGIQWTVGPYRLRVVGGFQRYQDAGGDSDRLGNVKGNMFLIGHDLFLWSPKGWFTGSSSEAGSVLFGTHFERTDVSCDTSKSACRTINGGEFSRNTILLREWDLWYFIANRMSIGIDWLWYDAANLRSGRFSTGENLGVFKRGCGSACAGKGGDWLDMSLNWRYQF